MTRSPLLPCSSAPFESDTVGASPERGFPKHTDVVIVTTLSIGVQRLDLQCSSRIIAVSSAEASNVAS